MENVLRVSEVGPGPIGNEKFIIFEDCIDGLENVQQHTWFNGEFNKQFQFQNKYRKYNLRQYNMTNKAVTDQVGSDIAKYIDLPKGVWSNGLQELVGPDGNSAIPPHSDEGPFEGVKRFGGLTIFLNNDWNVQWGGWNFLLEEETNSITKVTVPSFNIGIWIPAGLLHGAVPVYSGHVRRTLQMFYNYES